MLHRHIPTSVSPTSFILFTHSLPIYMLQQTYPNFSQSHQLYFSSLTLFPYTCYTDISQLQSVPPALFSSLTLFPYTCIQTYPSFRSVPPALFLFTHSLPIYMLHRHIPASVSPTSLFLFTHSLPIYMLYRHIPASVSPPALFRFTHSLPNLVETSLMMYQSSIPGSHVEAVFFSSLCC